LPQVEVENGVFEEQAAVQRDLCGVLLLYEQADAELAIE
jgi:hypothetical protein